MSEELSTTLHRLADSTTPLPVDDGLWERGQAARRRAQAFAVAAAVALVVSVGGVATLVTTTDQEAARTASSEVVEGGIPSRIDLTNGEFEDDWAIGRVSVALGGNHLVLIGAEDGRHHHFPVPGTAVAVSPDGYRVAWAESESRIQVADLRTGDVMPFAHNYGNGARVTALAWRADSTQLLWNGRDEGSAAAGLIDVTGPSESPDIVGRYGSRGIPSASVEKIALPSNGEVTAAPFLRIPADRSGTTGERIDRALPADLYPDGAVVTPIGWVDEDHVVAIVDPPQGEVVERPRLAVFTSPDRPESEWTWREFLPELPPEATSFAVDLIPDLTGDPDQELTHDFAASPQAEERDISWIIGLGVAAAIAVLMSLRWLWRRLAGRIAR